MMIAIIGAMQEEIDYLKKKMKNSWTEEVYHFEFHYGDIDNKKVVLVKSGVGKTNAGLLIGTLLSQVEVDYIINLGVCGGVSDKVNLFDLAV
ncbi:MAG TPA: 5'-methylthioadenosine/S-adenosylhomocysteine nucleosidase, partial [Bacilli bacterium]|nr:5'-methylthioadenosine/S-adenosylhomocysteine nucleosidase [Bacilli bacterium]